MKKVTKKEQFNSTDVIPKVKFIESEGGFDRVDTESTRLINTIHLQSNYRLPKKFNLPKKDHETFRRFFIEQQRLLTIVEVSYLRKVMSAQKKLVNKLVSHIKVFEKRMMPIYSDGEKNLFSYDVVDLSGANIARYIISYDVNDLRNKAKELDKLIIKLRRRHDRHVDFNADKSSFYKFDLKTKPGYYDRKKVA